MMKEWESKLPNQSHCMYTKSLFQLARSRIFYTITKFVIGEVANNEG